MNRRILEIGEYWSMTNEDLLKAISFPEFENAGRVHDWRNHIIDSMIEIWDELSIETRACLIIVAKKESSDEEWE